jgi:hypothetical protein
LPPGLTSRDLKRYLRITVTGVAVGAIIIGVAAAAVLRGAEMYHIRALTATYMQIESYKTATQAFIGQYHALPGDMKDATTRLIGCTAATHCTNGNGDGVIGSGLLDIYQGTAAGSAPEDETGEFWYHLYHAGLLKTGFAPAGPLGTGWGKSLPAAPAGGGYMVRARTGACINHYVMTGLFIRWQATPWANADASNKFAVSPADAGYIDRKFDDGNPLDGKVQARGSSKIPLASPDKCRAASAGKWTYAKSKRKACYMYFKIRESSGL